MAILKRFIRLCDITSYFRENLIDDINSYFNHQYVKVYYTYVYYNVVYIKFNITLFNSRFA